MGPRAGRLPYRGRYMSRVTRGPTRRPSVARFKAARFSPGVLYLAGRLSSASLSRLSGSGLLSVCVFATDSMLPTNPDITESRSPDVQTPDPSPVAPAQYTAFLKPPLVAGRRVEVESEADSGVTATWADRCLYQKFL